MNEDLIEETVFETVEEFKKELEEYLIYYNELRSHQGLNQKTPLEMNSQAERVKNFPPTF